MSNCTHWTEQEKEILTKMLEAGKKVSEIHSAAKSKVGIDPDVMLYGHHHY